jgi:hypothetical protein
VSKFYKTDACAHHSHTTDFTPSDFPASGFRAKDAVLINTASCIPERVAVVELLVIARPVQVHNLNATPCTSTQFKCDTLYKYTHLTNNCSYFSFHTVSLNPLSTQLYLSDLNTQSVPRSKHSLPRLQKTSQLMLNTKTISVC